MIIYFTKGRGDRLTKYLSQKEIDCKCANSTCTLTLVGSSSMKSFHNLREEWGMPLYITSGFRCQIHNQFVGGLDKSFHKLGLALDIKPKSDDELDLLQELASIYFDVVVKYDTFLHCHNLS